MQQLGAHAGTWTGTNAFRLMADDPTRDGPITATVAPAVTGDLAQITYAWTHPDDGPQEGLLVLGLGPDPATVSAFWGDSWHQHPEPRSLDGTLVGAVATVGYVYAGEWRWEIVVDATAPDRLGLTMHNVIPESAATADKAAGPYAVMRADLRRDG